MLPLFSNLIQIKYEMDFFLESHVLTQCSGLKLYPEIVIEKPGCNVINKERSSTHELSDP